MPNFELPPQMTEQVAEKEDKEILPSPERVETAQYALTNFVKLKPEETVVIFQDKGTKPETAKILEEAAKKIGSSVQRIEINRKTKKKEINSALESSVIIDLAPDSENKTGDVYDGIEESDSSRLVALLDLGPDAFDKNGPMSESPEDLQYRLDKMEQTLKDASGFKITSRYGTNLEMPLRLFKERRWHKDTGMIDEPGKWDNLPGGEIFTTPDERGVNGVLVLPVLESSVANEQGVDEFVYVNIQNGKISSIKGGASAEKLRKQLEADALEEIKEGENPLGVYQIAEMAFGANSKARSAVADPEQAYNHPAVSVVEAEKRLGTMHLAFGNAEHGEEGTEGFSQAASHHDFVIPRNGLTVEMFTNERDFNNKKNGRKIISEGGLNFF